jgi:transcriptional regulator with XRE-family HTH domain
MLSETITAGLKRYAIGARLRRLRLRKSMGLLELSRHTGLSPALLSKLERDVLYPTLPTLLRIAMVFSVGLDYFFTPEPKPVLEIVRRKDRMRFPESPESGEPAYFFESLDFPVSNPALNAYFVEFQPVAADRCRLHQHAGIEFLYLISGRIELRIGAERHELRTGDSIYFDPSVAHGYRRIGARRATAVVATTARRQQPAVDCQ